MEARRGARGKPTPRSIDNYSSSRRPAIDDYQREGQGRYKKIVLDHGAVDRLPTEVFLQTHREDKRIILDLDATDDPLRWEQSRKGVSSMAR